MTPPQRLSSVDTLRTALVAWIIGGHSLLGYSAVGGWAYDEVNEVTFTPTAELVLVAVLGPSGLFVIGIFFFIAGLFADGALARHGVGRYARSRLLRLGLPWLVSAVAVWPASVWVAYRAAGRPVSFWWVLTHRDPLLDSGSLWFALVLLIYSLSLAVWRRHVPPPRTDRALAGRHLLVVGAVVVVTTFVVRLWFPARSAQIGDLHLWQWPQCIAMFGLGLAAARHGWARRVPDPVRRGCGIVTVVALALLPLLALAAGATDLAGDIGPFQGGWRWEALATAAVEGVLVVAGSVWLLGLAQCRPTGGHRTMWSRGAFWAFALQGPVLMILASAARLVDAPAEVKAPLVGVAGIVACFWLGARMRPLGLSARSGSAAAGPAGHPAGR